MADPTPAQILGWRIAGARSRRGWSQKRLAKESGVGDTSISSLENGREVHYSNAVRIVRALGIPLDEPEARSGRR